MKPQYVPDSYVITTQEGKAQQVADAILDLAAQQGRKDVEVKGVLPMIDVVTLGCPEDFVRDVKNALGRDILSIERDTFKTIARKAPKKGPRP